MSIAEIVSAVFVLAGSTLALTAAIGIVRFEDTLSRMHASTKPQVIGMVAVLIGAIISLRGNVDIWMLVLVALFTVVTAPVIGHVLGRVAYREQRDRDGVFAVNELEPDAR